MSFGEPARLWLLLLPLAAALAAAWRHRWRRDAQRRLASPAVWRRLMGAAPATGLLRLACWCLAAALIVVALARPQWGEVAVEEAVHSRDLVLAVDVSDSMRATDLGRSRLEAVVDLLQRALPGLAGNRVGVLLFAGEAQPLVPLTTDVEAVAAFLEVVEPGAVGLPGSNLEHAVRAGLDLLPQEGDGRLLVLLSDGENLQGDPQAAARALDGAGVRLVAVVAGTAQGGPIPIGEGADVRYKRDREGRPVVTRAHPEVLAALAGGTGGETVELAGGDAVPQLVAAVERARTRALEERRTVRRAERFHPFVLAAAGALVLGFALSPWRRAAALTLVLLLAAPVTAGEGADELPEATAGATPVALWQRVVPGGARRLARAGAERYADGDYRAAADAFARAARLEASSERLYDLGTAVAQTDGVQAAGPLLERAHRAGAADAAFNLGTAALREQRAEEAVRWLREALLQAPASPAAKRNYELALRLLQQQQKQQQQQQEQDQEQDQDEERQQDGERPPEPQPEAQPQPENQALYGALQRAEAEARRGQQRSPAAVAQVEKDW